MEEDDEVIREIDVFIVDELELFLTQFPLKPVYADVPIVSSARYKPKHHKLELTVPYPTTLQQNFDTFCDKETHQKLISSEVLQSNCLGAAFINNERMFISPIKEVLQLRPVMKQSHQSMKIEEMDDYSEEENETEDPTVSNNNNNNSANKETGEGVQQIQLKRKESERAQSARLQSYSYIKQQEDTEPWHLMKVYPIGSTQSDEIFHTYY